MNETRTETSPQGYTGTVQPAPTRAGPVVTGAQARLLSVRYAQGHTGGGL
jgi:hypothetical protein